MQPAIARKVAKAELGTRETADLVRVVTNPDTPADVRKAVLEKPKVTAAHAEAIAQVPTAQVRETLINDAARGRATPEATARAAEAAISHEEAPPPGQEPEADRRLAVFGPLRQAKEALEEIDASAVRDLDREDLADLEPVLRGLGAQLNRIGQLMAAAVGRRQNRAQPGSKFGIW
ncbi:MAG TPA: hypothetical protein VNT01_12560 [Symbiobacteriaceae bacterium]|nr:hypothetical protein [Symbiobacteriaceae bacterium]